MIEPSEKALKTWVLVLASVASLMVALDALVVATALSTIRVDLGASIEALQWTMNDHIGTLSISTRLATFTTLFTRSVVSSQRGQGER
jgi:hypothetical protein